MFSITRAFLRTVHTYAQVLSSLCKMRSYSRRAWRRSERYFLFVTAAGVFFSSGSVGRDYPTRSGRAHGLISIHNLSMRASRPLLGPPCESVRLVATKAAEESCQAERTYPSHSSINERICFPGSFAPLIPFLFFFIIIMISSINATTAQVFVPCWRI